MVTVWDGNSPCMDLGHEMDVRTQALIQIFEGSELPLDERPPLACQCTVGENDKLQHLIDITQETVENAVGSSPNNKAAPGLRIAQESEESGTFSVGAVAELWKLALPVVARPLTYLVAAVGSRLEIPTQCKDGEIVFLRKPKGDGSNAANHYRTLNILAHL
eukprot:9498843-Pyramimonas_sp.AAC.1